MNNTIQTVRLANDPEVSTYKTKDGDKSRVSFGGYVSKRFKKDDEKDNSFSYVAFGATADFIAKYFKKGQMALITSEVNNNNYTDKEGAKHYGVQFVVDKIEFFGKKSDNETSDDGGSATEEKKSEKKSESTKTDDSYYDAYADF